MNTTTMTVDLSYINAELERLHKLVEQGKEIVWATAEISRLNQIVFQPPLVLPADFDTKKRYP